MECYECYDLSSDCTFGALRGLRWEPGLFHTTTPLEKNDRYCAPPFLEVQQVLTEVHVQGEIGFFPKFVCPSRVVLQKMSGLAFLSVIGSELEKLRTESSEGSAETGADRGSRSPPIESTSPSKVSTYMKGDRCTFVTTRARLCSWVCCLSNPYDVPSFRLLGHCPSSRCFHLLNSGHRPL
jgi:hypothetical protein